jgi:hypothetical protein
MWDEAMLLDQGFALSRTIGFSREYSKATAVHGGGKNRPKVSFFFLTFPPFHPFSLPLLLRRFNAFSTFPLKVQKNAYVKQRVSAAIFFQKVFRSFLFFRCSTFEGPADHIL